MSYPLKFSDASYVPAGAGWIERLVFGKRTILFDWLEMASLLLAGMQPLLLSMTERIELQLNYLACACACRSMLYEISGQRNKINQLEHYIGYGFFLLLYSFQNFSKLQLMDWRGILDKWGILMHLSNIESKLDKRGFSFRAFDQ